MNVPFQQPRKLESVIQKMEAVMVKVIFTVEKATKAQGGVGV
jgi:hypothetical protein